MLIGHSVNSPPNLLRPNDSANLGYPLPGISFGEGDNFFMGGIDIRHAVQIVRTAFAIRCFERLELSLSGSITDPDPYFDHVSVLRTPSGVLRETPHDQHILAAERRQPCELRVCEVPYLLGQHHVS